MSNSAPNTVTITSTTGPGVSAVAAVFTDVTNIQFDFLANTIRIEHGGVISYYDYSAVATITYTITAGHAAIVIST